MSKTAHSSTPPPMENIWIEICIISARGLPRSSLWKLQWFAVGWVDPTNKYCTRIDASGSANPFWRTKFTAVVDTAELSFEDCMLCVEVYSRDPIFLREKLHGTATISLKEFLEKHGKSSDGSQEGDEDVGSFQLRKKNSNKPHGFVDISIRTSVEKEGASSSKTDHGGFQLTDNHQEINLATEAGPVQVPFSLQPANRPPGNDAYTHPTPYPSKYTNPTLPGPSYPQAGGPAYQPPRTPPPPPPPSHVGYVPTFIPRGDNASYSYMNLPPSGGAGGGRPGGVGGGGAGAPAFAAGMGAGALAAGAVIFGDDFMSGFDFPRGLGDPSLTVSTDPPF